MKKLIRIGLPIALVAAIAAGWLLLRPVRPRPGTSYLVIVVDSMRADHLGAYGYPRPTAPRIEAMAHSGVVFDCAFSQAPWTRPSVASLFTSTYIAVHHVLFSEQIIDGEQRSDALNEKFLTLAEAMAAGGFATGGFGKKIHLKTEFGFTQGFEGYDMGAGDAARINRTALAWLRAKDPERFFIYLHYNDPHYPYAPGPGYSTFGTSEPRVQINGETKKAFREGRLKLTEEDRRQLVDLYDGEILYTDEHIGKLVDAVEAMGYGNLLVVLTADHGEEFLDHGDITHGQSLFGELVHVPFIVTGSALPESARGRRVSTPVQLIDIYPTLLDWEGMPQPPGLQGTSRTALLRGGEPGPPGRIFTQRREVEDPGFSDAASDGRWKLIRDHARGQVMLFDLDADPGETLRLEQRNPDVAAELTAALEGWSAANTALYEKIRPDQTAPLDSETEKRLRSLGYIQ